MLMYAVDNQGKLPDGVRDNLFEHFSFIHYLDGSVRWAPQQRMVEHYATIPHGAIRGYW